MSTSAALKVRSVIPFVIFCAISLRAQTSSRKDTSAPTQEGRNAPALLAVDRGDYLIGIDDLLRISILDVPEISGVYRVGNSGSVTVPVLTSPVAAAGLTLSQFSESLAKELKSADLVSDPHVSTSVDTSRLHSVAITGAIRKPQIYPVFSQTTLLDMLSQAEGLSDDASGNAVISRGAVGMRVLAQNALTGGSYQAAQTISVDVKRLLESGDPTLNVDIYPGDRITIPRAGIVYVVGAVNKPGGFTMRPAARGLTVLQALALAEDTTGTAKKDQTVIIRSDPQAPQGRKQIPVQLKKILKGKGEDPVLEAEDILFVPDSATKHALHRSLEAMVATTTGVAIYRGR
jgi:polysaccharide biosynthesis/export protein